MTLRSGKPHKIGDDFIDLLRDSFIREKSNGTSTCNHSQTAIAYALNELDVAESTEFSQHLRRCRECLELVIDVRASIKQAPVRGKMAAELLPAISAAVSSTQRSNWNTAYSKKIKFFGSKFKTYFTVPKLIAGMAAGCLVIFILSALNITPDRDENIDRVRRIISPSGRQQHPATSIFNFRSPKSNSGEHVQKIAPPKVQIRRMRTPLEKIELRNLKLIAVMLADSGNRAILRAPNGKEYMVTEGTPIGINSGRVARILNRKIIIEEKFRNAAGVLRKVNRELSIENTKDP